MAEQGHENDSHFPPEFILRAWAPDHRVRRAWVWDRGRWSENIRHERPEISHRGTVNLRSFDTTFIARGDAQENFRWNRLLETLVAETSIACADLRGHGTCPVRSFSPSRACLATPSSRSGTWSIRPSSVSRATRPPFGPKRRRDGTCGSWNSRSPEHNCGNA